MKNKQVKFNFTMSGFLIGIIMISMFAAMFGFLASEIQTEYNISGNHSLAKYNQINLIINQTEQIRNATDITQDKGMLDVIGGYLTSGYSALKITLNSFGLFENIIEDSVTDVAVMSFYKPFIIAIFIVAVFLFIMGILVKAQV